MCKKQIRNSIGGGTIGPVGLWPAHFFDPMGRQCVWPAHFWALFVQLRPFLLVLCHPSHQILASGDATGVTHYILIGYNLTCRCKGSMPQSNLQSILLFPYRTNVYQFAKFRTSSTRSVTRTSLSRFVLSLLAFLSLFPFFPISFCCQTTAACLLKAECTGQYEPI